MIDIQGLSKAYGSNIVLHDVNLQIACGERVAVLGPSGVGKSTLLRLIAGFEHPDHGTIAIGGVEMSCSRRLTPCYQRGIGMLTQDLALWSHMNIREHLSFALGRKLSRKERSERINQALQRVHLNKPLSNRPAQLSGGEQQRLALARALIHEPRVLLLDEPFNKLDFVLKQKLMEELQSLLQQLKITLVFVTHDAKEAKAIANRMVLLNQEGIEQVDSVEKIDHDSPMVREYAIAK